MTRFSSPLERTLADLSRQFGAVSHHQALANGMSEQQIRTVLAKGLWLRPARGVYVDRGSPDTPQRRAMVAWLSTRAGDGVLSFVTAAWALELLAASPLPHVTVRPAASPRSKVARVHRSVVPLADRVHRHGMTVTSPSRTILDLGSVLERSRLDDVIDGAFCRKLATLASVEACIGRMRRAHTGVAAVRASIAVWSPTIEPGSVAEMRLLRMLRDLGVTDLVTQHVVRGPDGFEARLDVAAPSLRRGLEYDSVLHHNPRRWARDEPRYATLEALGWRVDDVTKSDLLPGETRLRRLVEAWLCAREPLDRAPTVGEQRLARAEAVGAR